MVVTRKTITIPARPAQIVAGGVTSIPVVIVDSEIPSVTNTVSIAAGVETSHVFPLGTTNYIINTRDRAGFRFGFTAGIFVATPFLTRRHTYEKRNLNPTTTYTIFFGPIAKAQIFEIESWK